MHMSQQPLHLLFHKEKKSKKGNIAITYTYLSM